MKKIAKRAMLAAMVFFMSAGLTVSGNAASTSKTAQKPANMQAGADSHQETNDVAQAVLKWGNGYVTIINNVDNDNHTDMERYAYVNIDVYKSKSGEHAVKRPIHEDKVIKRGKNVKATTVYLAPGYNYEITAGIYNGPNLSYVLGWSTKKYY